MAEQTDSFTFTWHIEHFKMCPLKRGEYMRSPTFKVNTLQGSMWHIRLYPRGAGEGHFPSAYLFREGKPDVVAVGHSFSLITDFVDDPENGVTRILNQCSCTRFRSDEGTTIDAFQGLDAMFDRVDAFLVRGTLVVRCCLWPAEFTRDPVRESIPRTDESAHSKFPVVGWSSSIPTPSGRQLFGERRHWCAAHTRIPWQQRTVNWTLEGFRSLEIGRAINRSTPSCTFESEPELGMNIRVLGVTDDSIRLRIGIGVIEDLLQWRVFAKLELFVHDDDGFVFTVFEDEHFFEKGTNDGAWSFPLDVETRTSDGVRDSVLTRNGQLVLRFVFSVSRIRADSPFCLGRFGVGLKQELRRLYEAGKFCDVAIRTPDRTFPVHKNVLCARSDVFCAMFENDTMEKNTGVVDVLDLDPDTVDRMLDFMYSDELRNVAAQEDYVKLFSAADKYQVLSLKKMCASLLVAGLSVSSVCAVLELAELHQDSDLKNSVMDFIYANAKEVLSASSWTKLMESNSRLAGEVMHHILVKKL